MENKINEEEYDLILDGDKTITGRPEAIFGVLARAILKMLKNKDLLQYLNEYELEGLDAIACSNINFLKEDVEESKQRFAIWYEPNKDKQND